MLCLRCGLDNPTNPLRCAACEWFLGYVAEGQGFLPQLRELEKALAEGALDRRAATECLQRLQQVLGGMIVYVDQIGASLAALPLEAAQQGTLAGFLGPLREALVSYQETVEQLHPAGGWDPELWQQLETAQFSVLRGNEGLAFLAQHLHGLLLEKMQTDPDLRAELEAQAEAERQEAELADSETRPGQNIPDTPVVPPGL